MGIGNEGERFLPPLAAAPAILEAGDAWRGHSLCLLANALYPVRGTLGPHIWSKVEARWREQLAEVIEVLQSVAFPVDAASYAKALSDMGLFHAGPHYTRELLARLGVAGVPPWLTAAARALTQADNAPEAAGIVCVVEYAITLGQADLAGVAGRRLVVSEGRPAGAPPGWSEDLPGDPGPGATEGPGLQPGREEGWRGEERLVSVPLAHDRSGHAEFRALSELLASVQAKGAALAGWHGAAAEGWVRLYVTHHPCLSCVGAICQFRAALPRVAVSVAYDWHPLAPRGGAR